MLMSNLIFYVTAPSHFLLMLQTRMHFYVPAPYKKCLWMLKFLTLMTDPEITGLTENEQNMSFPSNEECQHKKSKKVFLYEAI